MPLIQDTPLGKQFNPLNTGRGKIMFVIKSGGHLLTEKNPNQDRTAFSHPRKEAGAMNLRMTFALFASRRDLL
jgi:hypothetical protein